MKRLNDVGVAARGLLAEQRRARLAVALPVRPEDVNRAHHRVASTDQLATNTGIKRARHTTCGAARPYATRAKWSKACSSQEHRSRPPTTHPPTPTNTHQHPPTPTNTNHHPQPLNSHHQWPKASPSQEIPRVLLCRPPGPDLVGRDQLGRQPFLRNNSRGRRRRLGHLVLDLRVHALKTGIGHQKTLQIKH